MKQAINLFQLMFTCVRRVSKKRVFVSVGVLLWLLFAAVPMHAQWIKKEDLKGDYVDGEPFDLVFLNEAGEFAILKIKPIADKLPPNPLPERGDLIFEYFREGDLRLEVPYSSIARILTFNEILIEEANQWIATKEYSKAFRNLFRVYNLGGKDDPTMVASMMNCLFLDGKKNFDMGEYELALSIFEDLYEKDSSFKVPGFDVPLISIVMSCHNGMIDRRFQIEDYIGVRQQLASLVSKYGKKAGQLKTEWKAKFLQRSNDLIVLAEKYAADGEGRQAHLAAKQADQMFPGRANVLELQKSLLVQFPLIVVGVTQDGADADPNRIEHWGSRRVGRLTQRTLIENTGLTDEGGKFEFLNGKIFPLDEVGLKYAMEIDENPTGFAVPEIDAFRLALRLTSSATETSPDYNVAWAKILKSVEIEGENRVVFTLRTPFVRPEALLKLKYSDVGENGEAVQNGFYVQTGEDNDARIYELNQIYPRHSDHQHPVIVEQVFENGSDAVDQLLSGNIDILDRVPNADLVKIRDNDRVQARPYILPTVHMLIPKIRAEAGKDPNFKNGLSHAIDRNLLVNNVISGGQAIDGCEVLSGPFPIGTEDNDQIAYAYDLKVRPLAFNAEMGMVMVDLALRAIPPVRPEPLPSPKLVIAFPGGSVASNSATAIARMWTEIGVETTTRELKRGETVPPDDNWDFLYLEVTMEEPLVDASNVIGTEGFATTVSAPIEQTLRNLSYARSWQRACADLRRLHRQTAVDLSVVPLYQVKEYFAYRDTVRAIGRDLIHLYQNVDRWKIDLTAEKEQQEK
jgi:peptide/nickel transport system substrate-binding protein